jgi:hypothetical protein
LSWSSTSPGSTSRIVRADTGEADLEDKIRVGLRLEPGEEVGLALEPGGVEVHALERRPPNGISSTMTVRLPAVSSSETRRTLPAPSWSTATGSGAPE